jgi:hypothetical protein
MKAKNNLELFKNEIMYEFKHHPGRDLWVVMSDIYHRETGNKLCVYPEMLDWFADVPRETLELDEFSYHLINEYYSVLLEEAIIDVDKKQIEWYTMFKTLIKMNIIPSRYSQMPLGEFMKIIRLKEDNKK